MKQHTIAGHGPSTRQGAAAEGQLFDRFPNHTTGENSELARLCYTGLTHRRASDRRQIVATLPAMVAIEPNPIRADRQASIAAKVALKVHRGDNRLVRRRRPVILEAA